MKEIQLRIENNTATDDDIRNVVDAVDSGKIRVAENKDGEWKVNTWVKSAIINFFRINEIKDMSSESFMFRDKIPLKASFENVRIVPGGNSIRYGSYLANNVIMMPPSYVNIGAYVGSGTMIDSNVLVGSCAQIGENVHLSAGVQIGGVLEPANANPVIIEDGAFIGAGVIAVEGILIRKNAVLAPGVVMTASTRIIETDSNGEIIREFSGEIPEYAIVIPGARQRGKIFVQTPVIIGYRNQKTNEKLELSDYLRSF